MHAAWSYQQGLLPFRDFFEHHMPGIYYLLGALLRSFDAAHDAGAALEALVAARLLMWTFALAIVVLTIWLGTLRGTAKAVPYHAGPAVGWLSGALLSTSVVFVARTLEIRPDVPGIAFWVASQIAFTYGLRDADTGRRRRWLAIGGLLLGLTLAFTQKALLSGPGFALFSLLYVSADRFSAWKSRIVDLVVLVAGVVLPIAAIAGHFAAHGAVRFLVAGVLTNNLGWIQEVSASSTLHWMLLRDPIFSALCVAGLVAASLALVRAPLDAPDRAIVLLPTLAVIAGLAFIPTPFPQYLLLVVPTASIYGAEFLEQAMHGAANANGAAKAAPYRPPDRDLALTLIVFAGIAVLGVGIAQPFFRSAFIYPTLAIAALAAIVVVRRRQPAVAAAIAIVTLSTYSLQQLVWMKGLSNADALGAMRFIHASTSPTDRVMDGFTGFGWFRPQASFYWFVAPGVRPRMTAEEKADAVAMLSDCRRQPKIVILDDHLRQLAPGVTPAVERGYEKTPYPLVWIADPGTGGCREPASPKRSEGGQSHGTEH